MNTVTGHPIVIIQICFKDLNLYICKQCGVLGYFVHYFWLFCSAIQAVGLNFLTFNPFLGPYIAYTYCLGVSHDHILYLLTLCFWFQNFVNGKQLSAVSWTKKFNHLG